MTKHNALGAKLTDGAPPNSEELGVPLWGSRQAYDECINELRQNHKELLDEAKTIDAAIMVLVTMRNRKFPLGI